MSEICPPRSSAAAGEPTPALLLDRLAVLQTELIDHAFTLESRGWLNAADVAMTTSARVGELREEFLGGRTGSSVPPADRDKA